MERIARLAVAFPITVLMIVMAILLLGYISLQQLGVDLFPDLSNPRLFVEISAGEEPPEEMERRFVEPLEAAAARGRGVERVAAVVQTGQAHVTVQYGWAVDMDEAYLDLQKAMADFAQRNSQATVTVSQQDPNAVPVVVAAFYHADSNDPDALRQTAESIIRNELIRLPGVAAVELVGARSLEVEILVDALTLEAYGLTVEAVAGAVQRSNRNLAGGSITEMGRRYVIRGVGEFESIAQIEDVIVGNAKVSSAPAPSSSTGASNVTGGADAPTDGEPIRLHQVAQVRQKLAPATNLVRLDGRRCLGLEIYKEAQSNTIAAAESIRHQLDILRRSLPGYELIVIQDQSSFVEAAVTEVKQTGVLGVLLAVFVLFLFLRRVGVTLVVSLAIPISVVATFNLMYFGDLTLNLMTLGGLALGAGMLVDNAIVVVESIFRRLEQGDTPAEAAARGTGDVGGAITSSTLTTIIVFLPIVYLHGAAGALFREQAWTVAFSLLSSLFVALVVIPMLCSRLLTASRPMPVQQTHSFYGRVLTDLLARRWAVIMIATAVVAGVGAMLPSVGSEFMPRTGNGDLSIELTLPEGTSIERTEGTVRNLEAFVKTSFEGIVQHIYARIGPGSADATQERLADENTAILQLLLAPGVRQVPDVLVASLSRELADLPDVDSRFLLQETALETSLGRVSAPLVVEIRGRQLDLLGDLAQQVASRLQKISSLRAVETTVEEGRPQVDVVIERTLAALFGLQVDGVATQLEQLLSGRDAGQIGRGGQYTDIVIRRPPISVEELSSLLLEAPDGRRVRLDQIADLQTKRSPRSILRSEQSRIVQVTAHLTGASVPFDQVARQVRAELAQIALPPEYRLVVSGEEEMRSEAFGNLRFALLLAVVLVYMVMAAQFESLIHPFVILLSIPLAGVGAIALLWGLAMPLNVMSFIGMIMLAGIAVNDSIILVDRINQGRRAGADLSTAIVEAGQARLRPILMTSVTTLLALLPLAVGFGEGGALRAPMAVAVIGGLVTSTTLTLVVIPCVYRVFARFDRLRPVHPAQGVGQ